VREAIFGILAIEWGGKEVLDLFAGTGGLGIEALSRGAHRVIFVENHPQSLLVLKKNLRDLKLTGSCELVKLKVEAGIRYAEKNKWKFDVVFLDPPYAIGLADSTLNLIAESNMLRGNSLVVVEHPCEEKFLEQYRTIRMIDQRRYGGTGVSFFMASPV